MQNNLQHVIQLAVICLFALYTGCVFKNWVDAGFSSDTIIDGQPVFTCEVLVKIPGAPYFQFGAMGDFGTGVGGPVAAVLVGNLILVTTTIYLKMFHGQNQT
jgi:hypothetical protein